MSKHDEEHLQKSLEKFGLIDKPIITQDGRIIGGHQRLKVLKKLGHKEVECFVPEEAIADADIDELCIRLNRAVGEWDTDILKDFVPERLLEWGFLAEEVMFADLIEGEEPSCEETKSTSKMAQCPRCGHTFKPEKMV